MRRRGVVAGDGVRRLRAAMGHGGAGNRVRIRAASQSRLSPIRGCSDWSRALPIARLAGAGACFDPVHSAGRSWYALHWRATVDRVIASGFGEAAIYGTGAIFSAGAISAYLGLVAQRGVSFYYGGGDRRGVPGGSAAATASGIQANRAGGVVACAVLFFCLRKQGRPLHCAAAAGVALVAACLLMRLWSDAVGDSSRPGFSAGERAGGVVSFGRMRRRDLGYGSTLFAIRGCTTKSCASQR